MQSSRENCQTQLCRSENILFIHLFIQYIPELPQHAYEYTIYLKSDAYLLLELLKETQEK